jgi:hypothetical protein
VAVGTDDDGERCVTVEQEARNQNGDLSARGTGMVRLPSAGLTGPAVRRPAGRPPAQGPPLQKKRPRRTARRRRRHLSLLTASNSLPTTEKNGDSSGS